MEVSYNAVSDSRAGNKKTDQPGAKPNHPAEGVPPVPQKDQQGSRNLDSSVKSDTPIPSTDSLAPRVNSVGERKQVLEQQREIALKNGASIATSQTTVEGKQLKGFDHYDKATNQREFLADNGNGTYTRYAYKDKNTLVGANGELVALKNKSQHDDDNSRALQTNQHASQIAAEHAKASEAISATAANRKDADTRVKDQSLASSLHNLSEIRARESTAVAPGTLPYVDLKSLSAQAASTHNKTEDLSAGGVLVQAEAPRVPPEMRVSHSDGTPQLFSQQDKIRSSAVETDTNVRSRKDGSGIVNESKSDARSTDAVAKPEQKHALSPESKTESKSRVDDAAAKHSILDSRGNQVNVSSRADVIDKINGAIWNTLSTRNAIDNIKDGVGAIKGSATIILIAAARVFDGAKGNAPNSKPDAHAGAEITDNGNNSQPRAAKLEDFRALTLRSSNVKELGVRISQSLLNNVDVKWAPASAAVVDAMKQLSDSQLKMVNKIFTTGLKPDFTALDDKAQIKLLAVFKAFADLVKGDLLSGQKQNSNEPPKAGDGHNPRGFIDSRLEMLQNCGLLKPLRAFIARLNDEPQLPSKNSLNGSPAAAAIETERTSPKPGSSARIADVTRPAVYAPESNADNGTKPVPTETVRLAGATQEESNKSKPEIALHGNQQFAILEMTPAAMLGKSQDCAIDTKENETKEQRSKSRSKRRTRLRCIVKEGDNIKDISQRYFGDHSYAPVIYHINKGVIQCVVLNGKCYAVLEPGTIILIPDDEDLAAYQESAPHNGEIDFGGMQAAQIDAVKTKVMSEQDSTAVQEATDTQAVETQSAFSRLQGEAQGPVSELLTDGFKLVESECFTLDEQGVRISLKVKHLSQWITICYYEIYPTQSKRRQYFEGPKHLEQSIGLPPAKVKSMAKNEFRNKFRAIYKDFLGA